MTKAREIVIEEFAKSDEEVKDGMDIALCMLDLTTNKLEFCGAYNPLYILRNDEIEIIKGKKKNIIESKFKQIFNCEG